MSEPIVFGRPQFDDAEEALVLDVLRSGWIGQGQLVERFEHELAAYLGAAHAVSVSSCTAALTLSLLALGVGPGDEVITTPFTFVATVNAIEHAGATPVLVDIDRATLNLSPAAAAAAVTPATRAVMPVHFGGRPIDMAGFGALAEERDLWIVDDAAHAIGAVSGGRRVGGSGSHRVLTCFSFYPNKNLASAEGGAITLEDETVAETLRSIRLHGLEVDAWKRYATGTYAPSLAVRDGHKANWTDLQAAIALPQLVKLEGFLATREYLAARYDELLSDVDGVRPVARPAHTLDERHALHLYQVAVESDRDALVTFLREQGILAAVHYVGVNHHPRFAHLAGSFPVSDEASRTLVSLPIHPGMSHADVERVVSTLVEGIDAVG